MSRKVGVQFLAHCRHLELSKPSAIGTECWQNTQTKCVHVSLTLDALTPDHSGLRALAIFVKKHHRSSILTLHLPFGTGMPALSLVLQKIKQQTGFARSDRLGFCALDISIAKECQNLRALNVFPRTGILWWLQYSRVQGTTILKLHLGSHKAQCSQIFAVARHEGLSLPLGIACFESS